MKSLNMSHSRRLRDFLGGETAALGGACLLTSPAAAGKSPMSDVLGAGAGVMDLRRACARVSGGEKMKLEMAVGLEK